MLFLSINSIFIVVLCFFHPFNGSSLYNCSNFFLIISILFIENIVISVLFIENTTSSIVSSVFFIFSNFCVIFSLPFIQSVFFLILLLTLFALTFCLHGVVNHQSVLVIICGYYLSKNGIPKSISFDVSS